MEGNLTKGPIMKTLVKLAVPIMASAFLGTLYNITDMAWTNTKISSGNFVCKAGNLLTKRDFHLQSGTLELQMGLSICNLPYIEKI